MNANDKAKVTFVDPDGAKHTIDAKVGLSLMESAVANGISGILAECGGACACATCHVIVDPAWFARLEQVGGVVQIHPRLEPAADFEVAMLDFVNEGRPESRLACQIKVTPDLEGLVVRVPESQG